jgi:hypothetical protein
MFPHTTPMSILTYPPPAVPYGFGYGFGQNGPSEVYGRPIYDSYGWSGPCYVGLHHDCLRDEEASTCTISWMVFTCRWGWDGVIKVEEILYNNFVW